MAKIKITLPNIDAETLSDKEMLRKILSYLYQLNEELRYQLTHIDDENIASEGLTESAFSANVYKRITQNDLTTKFEAIAGRVTLSVTRQELEDGLSTKLDSGDPSVGVSNASVTIDPDGIYLSTTENGQIVSRVGDDIELQIDKDGVSGKKGVFDSLDAPNIVQAYIGGNFPWQGTLQATLDALPKYLKADTTITIPAGTYPEDITIFGYKGARLLLENASGAKVTIQGTITISHCDRVVISADALGNFEVYPLSSTPQNVIYCHANTWVQFTNLNVSGYRSGSTYYGVFVVGGGFQMMGCCIEYTSRSAIVGSCSLGWLLDNKGGGSSNANTGYSIMASGGGHLGVNGTIPKSTSGTHEYAGTIKANGTLVQTEGGISYVAPTSFTQTFYPTSHCVYLLGWSRRPHTQASSLTQGSYRGEGGNTRFYAGLIWFDDAASVLSGKTIVSATLTLRRSNGGYSNAVPVWLSSSALTSADYSTTLSPTLTTPVNAGTLDKQTEGTFDVTSLMSAIQAGGAIAVYESSSTTVTDTWSPAYTHFYGKGSNYEPVLTVTYQ